MALQLALAGTNVACLINSLSYDEKIDDPATCAFSVPDAVGYTLTQYQQAAVSDTTLGVTLFTGFIDKIHDQALPGNLTVRMRDVTCTGNRWRAEKRYWTGQEFAGWTAGDAVAKMHQDVLAAEGVVAAYAMRHDGDAATWGAGTLTNTVATAAGLTLAAAGTDFTKTEDSTANFNAGTLTNVVGASGSLGLVSYPAIQYMGETIASLSSGNTLSAARKVWAGSYTLALNDEFHVDTWIDGTSPEIKVGIELLFSDGTWTHDTPINYQDQNGKFMYAAEDLNGWANDQWYQRTMIVNSTNAGKIVVGVYAVLMGQAAGTYTAYFKNVRITNSGATINRVDVLSGSDTTLPANVPASSSGYINVSCQVVTVSAQTGQRLSTSSSLTSVGIVKGSLIDWIERDAVQTKASNGSYAPQVLIESSLDGGATWQVCTNHGPIPSLILGMTTSGLSLQLRETLAVGGSNPQNTPFLDRVAYTVFSAPSATKTDVSDVDNTATALGTGVLTNCTSYSPGGLMTTGQYRNWDNLDLSGQTLFGATAGNPIMQPSKLAMSLRCDTAHSCEARFDFAGTWQNFIAEIDLWADDFTGGSEVGFVYRTTNWDNNDNSYAYAAQISGGFVQLRRAANGGTPGTTLITQTGLNLVAQTFYRVKIVVNGSTHQVFVNDAQYINATDSTYTAAGSVGVRSWNSTGARSSAHYDNFGIIAYASSLISSSTRVTPSTALSGIVGDSRVNWQATVPSTSTLLVESTIDGGTTWNTCTNGGPIPLLVSGFNAAGKSLKFRFTMTNQAINIPLALLGYSAYVIGQYSATGTRVSPVLATDASGTIGSSSITWNAVTPPNTSVAVSSSLNGTSFTSVAASGNPVNGLAAQGPMTVDDYVSNTAISYTASSWGAGVAPVGSWDTANSRLLLLSGTNGTLLWNTSVFPVATDVSVEAVVSQIEAAGFLLRVVDVNNLYYVVWRDASSASNPNTVTIRKRVASTDTVIVAATALPTTFTRGTYHTLKVTLIGSQLTAFFDGVQVAQVTDASLTAAGQIGLYQNNATNSIWYSLRAVALGATAVGGTVSTKVTLTTTDPTIAPVATELVTSVRGPNIMTGALLPSTGYAYKNTIAACIADAASKSSMYWRIDKGVSLVMKDRAYSLAPWPVDSADPLLLGTSNPPKLVRSSPLYRNRQYITGAIKLQSVAGEQKLTDGTAQSWTLSYPVDSVASITLSGEVQTVGVQGVDTGMTFYYQPGQPTLTTDSSIILVQGLTLVITYIGRMPYTAMRESTAQQAALALVDTTTGIVEASEDCGGLSDAAADALAQARIDQYAILSVEWGYSTSHSGLAPGQFQSVFVPQHALNDVDVLITGIHTSVWQAADGTTQYTYDVSTTSGPNVGTWQRIFAKALT